MIYQHVRQLTFSQKGKLEQTRQDSKQTVLPKPKKTKYDFNRISISSDNTGRSSLSIAESQNPQYQHQQRLSLFNIKKSNFRLIIFLILSCIVIFWFLHPFYLKYISKETLLQKQIKHNSKIFKFYYDKLQQMQLQSHNQWVILSQFQKKYSSDFDNYEHFLIDVSGNKNCKVQTDQQDIIRLKCMRNQEQL